MGGLLGYASNIASALLDDGSNLANNAQTEGNTILAIAASRPSSISMAGDSTVSDIMAKVNTEMSDAVQVVGNAVGDATSLLGNAVSAAVLPSSSNVGVLSSVSGIIANATAGLPIATSSEAQEFLPQPALCTTCNTSFPTLTAHNITIPPAFLTLLSTSRKASSSCSYPATITATPICPDKIISTCTITETWHSTHYASTATYFTTVANLTITCTETVR